MRTFLRALLAALLFIAIPAPSFAGVFIGISVNTPPPPLPFYVQPAAQMPNAIWLPGYWAWGPAGYFWVPGTWGFAPRPGFLWTPGYWGWNEDAYFWHPGYWARRVGFYGGINYGYGYDGDGYAGGRWFGNVFRYNTVVTNVNTTIIRNVSYNGGAGGVRAFPTAAQREVAHERHIRPTPLQRAHMRFAARDRNLLESVNHGRPAQTTVARPFTRMHPPAHFAPVTRADRIGARAHIVHANRQSRTWRRPTVKATPNTRRPRKPF